MSYVGRTIWDKRLPSFLGILVLLFALGTTVILSRNSVQFVTKATVGSVPKNVQISNVSANSFTISFVTDESTLSTVAYGNDPNMGSIALDTRDQQTGEPIPHRVHYIRIENLEPGTKYYFSITSGAQITTNNGSPFEVTTGQTIIEPPPANNTITGSVTLDDGSFPTEGLVYASTETSQQVAALVQPDGRFSIPLAQLRMKDLSTYLPLAPSTRLQLQISNGILESDITLINEQASEVPKIVLSKDYDFTLNADTIVSDSASDSAEPASGSAGFPIFDEEITVTSPQITTPEENQQFKDQQPLFKGKALPSTAIEIVINSEKEITASLQSDSSGNWEFRPPVAIDPGAHTMTVASIDASGTLKKLTRSFTVNAAGSQFTEPSVSPAGGTPTQAPPVTPTIASLPSPTVTPNPSPTASPSPTLAPSPTIDPNAISPTRGPLAETGSYATAAGIITSILFLAGGVILFFMIAV